MLSRGNCLKASWAGEVYIREPPAGLFTQTKAELNDK